MSRIRRPLGSVVNTSASATVQTSGNNALGPQAGRESVLTEAAPKAAPSKKRKSTDAAPTFTAVAPAAKKAKAAPKEAVQKAAKEIVRDVASSLLDVSDIVELEDEDDGGPVPVYDTCDTVRRKIRILLAKDGITQAAFLRAIVTAAYGENSTKKIQSTSLSGFMKQKGPLAGNTSAVYYAAYVFFEKVRIKQKKPKSNDREIMEEIHINGVDTTVQSGKIKYVGSASSRLGMDKYGRLLPF
ncbi:hypothetical protein B0H67DRAFT_509588 [Lasiosphaeris hirsuta]|uniref:DUF7726 domain-containing protein n=1 Tax=Lasiosphaeris hirsuta TaxID=260670 RepID=A0AA40AP02_9PEZI|nr:hypothetical protein B0H67DRAFT_509588 [Lasiosphaeris hirsuta]